MNLSKEKIADLLSLTLIYIAVLISLLPLTCFFFTVLTYRGIVTVLLRIKHGNNYCGLLKNHDALWSIEDETSLSVVHALILYQRTAQDITTSDHLLKILETKVKTWQRLPQLGKMFQRRKVNYGYSYLVNGGASDGDDLKVDDYVKMVDIPSKSENITEPELQHWISEHYNLKLPNDHQNMFEMIVSKKPMTDAAGEELLPVLFRMHHSMADGMAIVRLLSMKPADDDDAAACPKSGEESAIKSPNSSSLLRSISRSLGSGLRCILLQLPRIILQRRRAADQIDNNSLHCGQQSTRNFTNWRFERKEALPLLHKIRAIKALESGLTFQDVLCTSLSVTLYQYFAAKTCLNNNNNNNTSSHGSNGGSGGVNESCQVQMTEAITIGNAVQLRGGGTSLTNNCAYNFERLPVGPPARGISDLLAMLREVQGRRGDVTELQDANYMIVQLCALLPRAFLRKLVAQDRCSIGVSNVPGPAIGAVTNLCSPPFAVSHVTFYTPNRFKTRLGLSVFSLHGKLHFGMGGDSSAFDRAEEESAEILEGIMANINQMYEIVIGGK